MSIKLKLVSFISAFILVLSLVVVGVFAATNKSITMNGSVQFVVNDRSLFVKEVRMQETGSTAETITFTPGYINGEFNFDVGDFVNNRGSFTIYFDIINTTTTTYTVSVDYSGLSSITGLEISASPEVPASEEAITTITEDTPKTTTLELEVINPNLSTIDLSQIIITFEEYVAYNIQLTTTGNEPDGFYILTDSGEQYITGVGTYHFLSSFISFSYSSFTSTQSLQSKSLNAYSIGDVEFFAPGLGDTTRTLYFNEEVVGWYNITAGSTGWLSPKDFIEISEDYAILTYHPAQDTMTVIEF